MKRIWGLVWNEELGFWVGLACFQTLPRASCMVVGNTLITNYSFIIPVDKMRIESENILKGLEVSETW